MFEVDEAGNIRRLDQDPEQPPTSIFDAAASGDMAQLSELLDRHPDLVNALGEQRRSPLHWAAVQGQVEAAELLLARGADVHVRDDWGATPLSCVGTYEEPLAWDRCPE